MLPCHAGHPGLTTDATAGPIALGNTISDTAHLSGTATQPNGSPAGGSISFAVYGPDDLTCANAPAFTSGPISVQRQRRLGSGKFTPTAAGNVHLPRLVRGQLAQHACGDHHGLQRRP